MRNAQQKENYNIQMKTIEITDEMHQKLVELATEMTTQDMRCTAMPHMFQVQDQKQVYDWGLNGEFKIWLNSDYDREVETFDELVGYLERINFKITKKKLKAIWEDTFDLDNFMKENCSDLQECTYSYEYIYTNTFFTATACQEHIDENRHHYKNPVVYLNHAWRNPEMDLVSKFLCGIINKEPHK